MYTTWDDILDTLGDIGLDRYDGLSLLAAVSDNEADVRLALDASSYLWDAIENARADDLNSKLRLIRALRIAREVLDCPPSLAPAS